MINDSNIDDHYVLIPLPSQLKIVKHKIRNKNGSSKMTVIQYIVNDYF